MTEMATSILHSRRKPRPIVAPPTAAQISAASTSFARTALMSSAGYLAAAVISALFLLRIMKLWQADLSVPMNDWWDALFSQICVKGILEHGWYLRNPSLGAPGSLDMRDYPMADTLFMFIIKLLCLATQNYAVAFNLFYLFSFPLATLTCLFVLRRLGVSYAPALVASLLYSYLPYHFERGQRHLFLSAYFVVPFAVLLALWLYLGRVDWSRTAARGDRRRFWAGLALAVLMASSGVYYAFFTCFLLAVAGLVAALDRRSYRPLVLSASLVAATSLALTVNISPSLLYRFRHGPNPEVAHRSIHDSEYHALKIGQLILPAPEHRIAKWAHARAKYDTLPLADGEKRGCSLGLIGSVGFLFLLVTVLRRRAASETIGGLAVLNVCSVLLATIGGFGSLFSLLVTPQIRGWNRISIFIALCALAAVALLLDRCGAWWARLGRPRWQFHALLATITVLGMIDEVGRGRVPDYAGLKARFQHDQEFIARIEAALPPGAMVLEMPYCPFPEFFPNNGIDHYEPARPYFHSRQLHWSYGAMKGRADDLWQRELATRPIEEQVRTLLDKGFAGIYIDRQGYADRAAELESKLARILGVRPIESGNGRMSFVKLTATVGSIRH